MLLLFLSLLHDLIWGLCICELTQWFTEICFSNKVFDKNSELC